MQVRQVSQDAFTIVNMEEAACASSYNQLLASDGSLGPRVWQALLEAQERRGVVVDGRPLCSVLRPRFISEEREQELARVSRTIARLMERIGEQLLASDRLLDLISANEQEREIWEVDPGFPGFTVTSRLDSFMVGTQPQFIEYNAESPAGIAFSDVLSEIFAELPTMKSWPPAQRMRTFNGRRHLLDTLLWAHRQRGDGETPVIAIIDWEHVITRRDFELCAEYFRDQGVDTYITDPRRLRYRNGAMWLGDQKINLIYRRVLLHELLDKADEVGDLLAAYRDGAVCIVNSPRSKLLHKKGVFALLGDGTLNLPLDAEEQSALDRTIPWTRLVREGTTTYGAQEVDLAGFVLDQRERLVMKPVDDYGGKGVFLGWESTPEQWERALERALQEQYVVQERVPMPQGEFPMWRDEAVSLVPLLVDTDPLLFRTEMGGILTRTSAHMLLNVSAGTGSAAPTFVVPEEGD